MKDADLLMSHFPSPCKYCSSLFGSLYLVLLFYALSFWYLTNEAYATSLYIFSMLCPFDTLQMKHMLLHYIYFLCFVLLIPYKWSVWYSIICIFYALSFWYVTKWSSIIYIFYALSLQMKRIVLHYIYAQFLCFVIFNPSKWSFWYSIIYTYRVCVISYGTSDLCCQMRSLRYA